MSTTIEPTADEIERVGWAIFDMGLHASYREQARAAILAMDRRAEPPEQSPGLRALMESVADTASKKMGVFNRAMEIVSPPAQAVAVPEGWKLVPVEPTGEMLYEAGRYLTMFESHYRATYAAMLAAAPEPPATRSEAEIRNEGIEAAAKWHDGLAEHFENPHHNGSMIASAQRHRKYAAAIRSLAQEPKA